MAIQALISLAAVRIPFNNAASSQTKENDMATQAISREIIAFRQGIRSGPAQESDMTLAKGELFAVAEGDWRLVCMGGALWLTCDGDQEDHILRAGDQFSIRRGDRAAVQALRPASIRLYARP